jgi:hypothetical protein
MLNYMFRKAKETVKAMGILSTPNHSLMMMMIKLAGV